MDGMDGTMEATAAEAAPATSQQLTLREQITKVGLLRRQVAVFGAAMQRIRAAFEAEHAPEFQMHADLKAELGAEEQRLRQLTIDAYETTGNRKPAPGVSVRTTTELVYEEALAFAWGKERGLALTLDKKGFEAIAKVTPLDFVTRREVPQATLAKELPVEFGDESDVATRTPASETASETASVAAEGAS